MSESSRRRWFHVSLRHRAGPKSDAAEGTQERQVVTPIVRPRIGRLSAFLGALLALVLLLFNWHGERIWQASSSGSPPFGRKVDRSYYEHGWPLIYLERGGKSHSTWSLFDSVSFFDPQAFAIDVIASIGAVVLFLFCLEHISRRRGPRWQFSIADILAVVTIVSFCLGWWKYQDLKWEAESRAIKSLGAKGFTVTLENKTPLLLRELCDPNNLSLLDRAVSLTGNGMRRWDATPQEIRALSRIKSVDFSSYRRLITDDDLISAFNDRRLRNINLTGANVNGQFLECLKPGSVRELIVADTLFDDLALAALSRQPNLEILNLSNTRVTDEGLQLLKKLTGLRLLDLRNTHITTKSLDTLTRLTRLECLALPGRENRFVGVSIRPLLTLRQKLPDTEIILPFWEPALLADHGRYITANRDDILATIDLWRATPPEDGLYCFANQRLKGIQIGYRLFDDNDLKELAGQRDLEVVDLAESTVTDEGISVLVGMPKLAVVGLRRTKITDLGLELLSESPVLKTIDISETAVNGTGLWICRDGALRHLIARHSQFDDVGLAEVGRQKNIEALDLRETAVTNHGICHLAGMGQLRSLKLSGTRVTEDAIETLSTLTHLEELTLPAAPKFSAEAVLRLQKLLPTTDVKAE